MAVSVYQQGGYGTAPLFPNPIIARRDPTTTDKVSPTGLPYQIFQGWNNELTDANFIYLGGGNWVTIASVVGSLNQLTGNAGIALPAAGNINIVGVGTLSFAGAGSTITGTITPGTGLIATLTGNSGGALSPTAGNFNILGNNALGINISGAGSTLTVAGIQGSTTQVGVWEGATAVETQTGTDATRVVTPASLIPSLLTPYVVGAGGAYTTVQSAVTAAQTAGGGVVYVKPGTYIENVTMTQGVILVGLAGSNGNIPLFTSGDLDLPVIIQGNFTLNLTTAVATPTVWIENIQFTANAGIVFTYTGNIGLLESGYINFNNCKFIAGTAPTFIFSNDGFFNVNFQSCVVDETTPGTTNFITWGATPFLNLNVRDSWININPTTALVIPTGSFNVFTFQNTYWGARLDASAGTQTLQITAHECVFNQSPAGAGDPLFTFGANSGSVVASNCVILSTSGSLANSTAVTAADIFRYNNCIWNNALTIGATGRGEFSFCEFYGDTSAAITFSSSQACSVLNSVINSTNNPAIAGAGAGILTLGENLFTGNALLAGTLTVAYGSIGGVLATKNVAGASPQIVNARTGQVAFTDVVANGAYGTLTLTNSTIAAASVIVASVSCTTVNSACQIVETTPGAGSVAFRIFNAGSASTAADILVNFWVIG